jgi:hypothetical protein
MMTVSTDDPQFVSAIQACAVALRRLVAYELAPSLHNRPHTLGERKECLNQEEHEALLALVDFAQQRTLEKLEAQVALDRLRTALPGVLPDACGRQAPHSGTRRLQMNHPNLISIRRLLAALGISWKAEAPR